MTIPETKKLANHIIRLLKVSDVIFPIVRTSKGNFGLRFNGNDDFEMYLDAVPLSTKSALDDDKNIELKQIIEKYLFESEITAEYLPPFRMDIPEEKVIDIIIEPKTEKKKGRPKGSKNKVKAEKA